ncbi:hypothetical protein F5Y08DRAFT_308400 [Xylaria arbuscula]|nr:hypothetical protein F5Y08DRAFT_308400 [Xylaria arbuscula]
MGSVLSFLRSRYRLLDYSRRTPMASTSTQPSTPTPSETQSDNEEPLGRETLGENAITERQDSTVTESPSEMATNAQELPKNKRHVHWNTDVLGVPKTKKLRGVIVKAWSPDMPKSEPSHRLPTPGLPGVLKSPVSGSIVAGDLSCSILCKTNTDINQGPPEAVRRLAPDYPAAGRLRREKSTAEIAAKLDRKNPELGAKYRERHPELSIADNEPTRAVNRLIVRHDSSKNFQATRTTSHDIPNKKPRKERRLARKTPGNNKPLETSGPTNGNSSRQGLLREYINTDSRSAARDFYEEINSAEEKRRRRWEKRFLGKYRKLGLQ